MAPFLALGYLGIAVLTFGWQWHRDCALDPNLKQTEQVPVTICAGITSIIWPVTLVVKILDPANIPTIRLPTVKFD